MRVQLLKVNKNHINVSSLSEFLSSPFSPTKPAEPAMAMGNTSLPLALRENTSLGLKKRQSLLESKLQASSEKISSLQGPVSLLNMCLKEENQGRLKTDKELQILDKDLQKQIKENESLTLKLCQKRQIKKTKYQKQIKN